MPKTNRKKTGNTPKKKPNPQPVSAGDLMDDIDKFEHFVTTYWRQIIYGCVAVIVVVSVAAIVISTKRSRRYRIESKIAEAKGVDELKGVIADYPTFPLINSARMRLANSYFEDEKYDDAIKALDSLIAAGAKNELLWRAEMNIAYALELKGDQQAAAAKFSSIGADSAYPDEVRAEANYGAGRLNVQVGDLVKAKGLLETVSKQNAEDASFWKEQSKSLLDRLNADPASLN